ADGGPALRRGPARGARGADRTRTHRGLHRDRPRRSRGPSPRPRRGEEAKVPLPARGRLTGDPGTLWYSGDVSAFASLAISASTACTSCKQPLPLNGATESVLCDACRTPVATSPELWKDVLAEALDEVAALSDGEG